MSKGPRTHLASTIASIFLLFAATGLTAQEPPPPPDAKTSSQPAAPEFVETEASPIQGPGLPVAESAEGVGSLVRLSEIPTARSLGLATPDPLAAPMSHIQGSLVQRQEPAPGSELVDLLTGAPLAPAESPAPTGGGSTRAAGDTVTSFQSQGYTGWIPPDTIHAVGPNHIVLTVNSGFTVYSKLGTVLRSYTTFDSFLHKPSGWDGFMFDPRIVFDRQTGRFVMLVLGRDDTNRRSYVWTASTADPTGSWWRVRFNVTRNQDTANEAWLDYAGLGVDDHGLYWTGNYFRWSGGFDTSVVRTSNPNLVTGTGAGGGYVYTGLTWPSGGSAFALQPAHPHNDNSADEMFFVNSYSGSGNKLLLWRFSGDRYSGQGMGSGPSLTRNEVTVGRTYYALGENVNQGGSATDIDGFDSRVNNAVYQNRRVYATLTDAVSNLTTRSGIYTLQVNTDTNTTVAEDLLWTSDAYRFFPAVTVDGLGASQTPEVAIYYNWVDPDAAGNTKYVSATRKIYTSFPTGGPDSIIKSGEGPYVRFDSNGRNRWGDYSGAVYDWTCNAVSGSLEYAESGNLWGTWIRTDEIGNGKCPQMEVTAPNGGEVWNAGTNRTITWKSADLTSTGHDIFVFFDTGTSTTQIAGPLSPFSTSFVWNVPASPTLTGKIFVGNWNTAALAYEASDWSDANFRVTAPDLRTISPGVSQTLLMHGESFTASATVNNQGDGSSNTSTTLRYYASTNSFISTGDIQIGTDPVSVLGAGGSSPESQAVNAPLATGTYWIGACVDSVAGETSFLNQCSSGVPITVRPPDHVVVNSVSFTSGHFIDACESITIGENVDFQSGSTTTFRAPLVIVLNEVTWLPSSTSTIENSRPSECP